MPTYRTRKLWYEDGGGQMSATLVMSDTYEGLFETVGVISTDVFFVQTTKKDIDKDGTMQEDELSIVCDESMITTTDDANAVQFFLDAQDPANKRFVALFLNAPDLPTAPTIDDVDFNGILRTDHKATDLKWLGGTYDPDQTPLREWTTEARSFGDGVLELVPLEALIWSKEVAPSVMSTGIDTTWESTYVVDRQSFYKTNSSGYIRTTHFHSLVNLNELLQKLANNLTATLNDLGLGSYTVNILESVMDYRITPVRFIARRSSGSVYIRELTHKAYSATDIYPAMISTGDTHEVRLGGTGNDDTAPFISYRKVKYEGLAERDTSIIGTGSLPELLYSIAENFGCFVRFEPVSTTELNVRFIPKSGFTTSGVYVWDATDASLNTSLVTVSNNRERYVGKGHPMTTEGIDVWKFDSGTGIYSESERTKSRRGSGGKQLLFCMSGGIQATWGVTGQDRGVNLGKTYDVQGKTFFWHTHMPINNVNKDNGSPSWVGHIGIDTRAQVGTLYLKTVPKSGVESTDQIPTATDMWLPWGQLSIEVEGVEEQFNELAEYLDSIQGRDVDYFGTEYELTIPCIGGFRDDIPPAGTLSWKHLVLGATWELDGVLFAVVGIERDYETYETKIRLVNKRRFAFASSTSAVAQTVEYEELNPNDITQNGGVVLSLTAGEDIEAGDAVVVLDDGKVWRAKSISAHYGKFLGIAMNDAVANDPVEVVSGRGTRVTGTGWTFTPGERVYVRTATHPASNLSQTVLVDATATEDLVMNVGFALTSSVLILDNIDDSIYV